MSELKTSVPIMAGKCCKWKNLHPWQKIDTAAGNLHLCPLIVYLCNSSIALWSPTASLLVFQSFFLALFGVRLLLIRGLGTVK